MTNLNCDVMGYLFSFLDTKSLLRTRVVCKKWKLYYDLNKFFFDIKLTKHYKKTRNKKLSIKLSRRHWPRLWQRLLPPNHKTTSQNNNVGCGDASDCSLLSSVLTNFRSGDPVSHFFAEFAICSCCHHFFAVPVPYRYRSLCCVDSLVDRL